MLMEINKLRKVDLIRLDEIKDCCINRLTMLESPLHATGYVLHPLWTTNGPKIDCHLQMVWMKTRNRQLLSSSQNRLASEVLVSVIRQ